MTENLDHSAGSINEGVDQSKEVKAPVDNSQAAEVKDGATGATPTEETFDINSVFEQTLNELGIKDESAQPQPQTPVDPQVKLLQDLLEKERQEKINLYRENQSYRDKTQNPPRKKIQRQDSMDEFLGQEQEEEEVDPEDRPMTLRDYQRREAEKAIANRDKLIGETIKQVIISDPALNENPYIQNHFAVGFAVTARQNDAVLNAPRESVREYFEIFDKGQANLMRNISKYKDKLPELYKISTEIFKKGYETGKSNKTQPITKPASSAMEFRSHEDNIKSLDGSPPKGIKRRSIEDIAGEIAKDIDAQMQAGG